MTHDDGPGQMARAAAGGAGLRLGQYGATVNVEPLLMIDSE